MYESLINQYEVIFEGIPEPIFYGRYYPMGHKEGPHGNELWDLFNYGRGLKRDKDPSAELYNRFENVYESDIRALLNCVMQDTKGSRRGVVVIPSSKFGVTNRATELVQRILASNPGPFADLTKNFVRVRQKYAAHEGGDRSIASNIDTLEVRPRGLLSQYGAILVIDDIVTSGNSFRAADEVLRRAGFTGAIINFALSRTFPSDVAMLYQEASQNHNHILYATGDYLDELWGDHPLDGLILDLDQTLVDDPVRSTVYEENLWRDARRQTGAEPYSAYDGVDDILDLHLPTAVLSNRPIAEIEHIIEDSLDQRAAYHDCVRIAGVPVKPFSFPAEKSGTYTIRYYKPSSRGVEEAVEYLEPICGPCALHQKPRIVGVGNTKEDIFAYNNASIESILALWGVPDFLKDYASKHWGAALVFTTPQELAGCLGRSAGYYEKAVYYESVQGDKERAQDYYDLAIKYDDHVKEAAFRLAFLIDDSNPDKAIELYATAIEAGDEYAATNNLALLVESDNPERARELFERAIAAGNVKLAPRNLALLVAAEDPDRAVALLKQAAEAGNVANLADDLRPLALSGHAGAFELYRDFASASDGDKARELANLLSEVEPEKAKELLKAAINAGDEAYATRSLALLLVEDDPDQAIELLERAARAGNAQNLLADLKPLMSEGCERAIRLFEDEVVAKDGKRAFDLAVLVADHDKPLAKNLYEQAIAAGDEYASTNNLANLIANEDPDRAKELYERAIAAGDERFATNNLANQIASTQLEEAISLYERAIRAGDGYYAPRNLALKIITENPNRAVELLELSARNGNKGSLATDLEPAIRGGNQRAVELYEREIVEEDELRSYDLANMIVEAMPAKAEALYRRAIAAGDERYATFSLAALISGRDQNEAEMLYERSIKAGDTKFAPNNLGALIVSKDPNRARSLFRQSAEAGDEVYATCNLAHSLLPSNADRAIELYERSLHNGGETEAKLGLAYLLKDTQPERASKFAAEAQSAPNMASSFDFLIEVVMAFDKDAALEIAQYFIENGYRGATNSLIKLGLGDNYDPVDELVFFGTDIESGTRIPWLVLGPVDGGILLLSKNVIHKMPFVDDAPEATWDDSAVRRWLNGFFEERYFSADEINSTIARPDLGGRFFCLSGSEFDERLPGELGKDSITAFDADGQTAIKWWLRPEEGGTLSAPCIDEAGNQTWSFALVEHGVRPAVILGLRY